MEIVDIKLIKEINHIKSRGIKIIHVDFLPEHTHFYETCGFRIGLGGIYESEFN